jgi:hypothetical protein
VINAWFLFQYINETYIFVGENVEICAKQMPPVSLPACTDKKLQLQSHIFLAASSYTVLYGEIFAHFIIYKEALPHI